MNLMSPAGVVEDELLPELADNAGTTRGTKLSVLQIIVFLFLVQSWLWTADPLKKKYRDLRKACLAIGQQAFP